jgi:ribosomal protein S12
VVMIRGGRTKDLPGVRVGLAFDVVLLRSAEELISLVQGRQGRA